MCKQEEKSRNGRRFSLRKRMVTLLLLLSMAFALLPAHVSAAGNSYVMLHPSSGTVPTGVKVSVGDKINGFEVYQIRGKDIYIDLGRYNVSLQNFRIPKPEEVWEGVAMQYNPQTYVIAGTAGAVHKTPGSNALLGNGGNTFYYYNLGPGGGTDALWSFTLNYSANNGTGAPAPQSYSTNEKYNKSHSFTVSAVRPVREGFSFLGWADSAAANSAQYQPGGTCTVYQTAEGYTGGAASKTIYAVWQEKEQPPVPTYTVTYTDGVTGEEVFKDQVYSGLTAGTRTPDFQGGVPTRPGFSFEGWSPKVADSVTKNVTYISQWKQIVPEPSWDKLTVTKSADRDTAKPGETVVYTVTVTNQTGTDLKNVSVTDSLDPRLSLAGAEPAGQYNAETGVWTVPSLKNGESAALTIRATVAAGVTDREVIPNLAVITGAAAGDIQLPDGTRPSGSANVTAAAGGGPGGGGVDTSVTLHYETNGGTEFKDERHVRNALVRLDRVPTREGYRFVGWYADRELTEKIASVRMTGDKTVYACWRAASVPDRLNGDDHFAYVIGYPDGTVRPGAKISRAETAAIFFRLLKPGVREDNLTSGSVFEDVGQGMWYRQSISTLAALGIVKGRTPVCFAPEAPISRAEFAAICARFDTGVTKGDGGFTDLSGHWAQEEIERAASLGWIAGYPDGTFRPDQPITRAEAMTMVNRVLCRMPEKEADLLDGMNVWPDNQPGAWYYLAVQEATNSHNFTYKGEIYEYWTELTDGPDWAQYQN